MERKLLVYVHVPFCNSKCHFCDWVTGVEVSDLRLKSSSSPRRRYLEALQRQIAHWGPILTDRGYVPDLLYWGGGTASILTHDEIRLVAGALDRHFDLGRLSEATIECSPETLTPDKLTLFLETGFDRISIGLQSMDDDRLRTIGRAHDAGLGVRSVRWAHEAGFDNISVDMISGMPGQSVAEFEESVRQVLDLPIHHVALYSYRPSIKTVMRRQLKRGYLDKIDLQVQLASYQGGRALLETAGLPEYAVSHFGKKPCRSDLAYFQLQMDWIGFGSGAISMLDGELRQMRRGQLHGYIDDPIDFDDVLPAGGPLSAPSLMYLSLTTREGARRLHWDERTGMPLPLILQQPEVRSLLEKLGRFTSLTVDGEGIYVDDDHAAEAFIRYTHTFLPENARTGHPEGTVWV